MHFLLIVILYFITINPGQAGDLYSNCVKGYDFGGASSERVILTPLNATCQARCRHECNAFSRTQQGGELNEEVILQCMSACQAGDLFRSPYYQYDAVNNKVNVMPSVATSTACPKDEALVGNNVFKSGFSVNNGSKIYIRLQSGDNKVYLCGKKIASFVPVIPNFDKMLNGEYSLDQTQWNDTGAPPLEWKNSAGDAVRNHMCFTSDSVIAKWGSNITNKELWNLNSSYFNGACRWHARNYNYTSTGLYITNGDELAITWWGNYAYDVHNNIIKDRSYLINYIRDPNNKDHRKIWRDNSALHIKPPSVTSLEPTNAQPIVIYGEDARAIEDISFKISSVPMDPSSKAKNAIGLVGTASDMNLTTELDDSKEQCKDKNDPELAKKTECIKITNAGLGRYTYSGIFSNGQFANQRSLLALRHYDGYNSDINILKGWYSDNVGGYNVQVNWGGCPMTKGQNMQYAVSSEAPREGDWRDVPEEVHKGQELTITNVSGSGDFYLRIKPAPEPNTSDANIKELYKPHNRHGQYYVILEDASGSGAKAANGPIYNMIKSLDEKLFGTSDQRNGVVTVILRNIYQDPAYKSVIYTMILAYISFFAVGFMIGIIELNQKEALVRLVKIGIVLAVISPESIGLLNDQVIPLFVNGSREIIIKIISSSFPLEAAKISEQELNADNLKIFEIFDGPLLQLFSAAIWKKVCALVFTGLTGVAVAIMIIWAAATYCIAVIKTVVIYTFALLATAFLLVTSIVFIPCILFQQTKSFFDNWVKYLISYSLQPILLFASISLFNLLIMTLLYIILGFSVCEACYFRVNIPLFDYNQCWLPGYRILLSMHLPGKIPNFFSPIQLLSSVVCFLILAHGMSRFCSFISELTSRIVAGDMKIGGAGGLASRGHRAAEGAYDSFASTKYGSVITSAAKDTVKGTQNVTRGALKSITGISFWDKK